MDLRYELHKQHKRKSIFRLGKEIGRLKKKLRKVLLNICGHTKLGFVKDLN